jgi:hypothetical protein
MNPGHESLRGACVRYQVRESVQETVTIAELDRRGDQVRQSLFAHFVVRHIPSREPAVHNTGCVGAHFIRHHVAEQSQLKAPALDVFVARRRFRGDPSFALLGR